MLKRMLSLSKYCFNTELFVAMKMLPTNELYKKMKLALFVRLTQNKIMYELMQDTFLILQTEKDRESIVKDVLDLCGVGRDEESDEFEVGNIKDLASLAIIKIREIEQHLKIEYENNQLVKRVKNVMSSSDYVNKLNEALVPQAISVNSHKISN